MTDDTVYSISQYILGDGIDAVDAFRFDRESGEYDRIHFPESKQVLDAPDAPDEWVCLGLAEDYHDAPRIWAVYADPETRRWGTYLIADRGDPGEIRWEEHSDE
jgi:hypothetical protein